MKNNIQTKLSNFCNNKEEEKSKDEVIAPKDGLFERVEYVNKKYVTADGRQLLKETLFEA